MQVHPSQSPPIGNFFKELSLTLTLSLYECEFFLCQHSEQYLAKLILCFHPFYTTFTSSHESVILDILHFEFGDISFKFFTQIYYNFYQAQTSQQSRKFLLDQ